MRSASEKRENGRERESESERLRDAGDTETAGAPLVTHSLATVAAPNVRRYGSPTHAL